METSLEILKSPKMNYILNEIMGGGASSIKAVKRQSPFYEMVWVTHIGLLPSVDFKFVLVRNRTRSAEPLSADD